MICSDDMLKKGLREVLQSGEHTLCEAGIGEAKENAWFLFSYITGLDRAGFYIKEGEPASDEIVQNYIKVIERRCSGEPLEYITHSTSFMGYDIYVDESVLIPRQDTECVVERALPVCDGKDVLDMCTGSGCIGISIRLISRCGRVVLSDISERSLIVAKKNAKNLKADVEIVGSDLFENIEDEFDIIISNPPYIRTDVIPDLMREVKDHEPLSALDGGADGLYFYRRITTESLSHLRVGGYLIFEIGFDQGMAVSELMMRAGYNDIAIYKDLSGLDRVVMGHYGG